jgi:DNA-binding PadR family transcriptional regulator
LRDVEEISRGRVTLRPGTLYGSLDRLVDEGLVVPDRDEVEGGRLRRFYRITAEGRRRLATETERLATNARVARLRLGLKGRLA